MTQDPTSPSETALPDPSRPAPQDFLDGLALNRLNRLGIVSFLQGLPRRVNERAARALDSSPSQSESESEPIADDEWLGEMTQLLAGMTDQLDALIERLQACGYPLNPSRAEGVPNEPPDGVPPPVHPSWKRFVTAATEAVRWADGVPSDAWVDDDLLARSRSAVGELSWLLRQLEARPDPRNNQLGLESDGTG